MQEVSQTMSYGTIIEFIMNSDPKAEWEKSSHANGDGFECHFHRFDVNIRFEREKDNEDSATRGDFKTDWTDKFPNRKAHCSGFRLYYASTLIETFRLISIDGVRLPTPMDDETTVSRLNYRVAQICSNNLSMLDMYMERAGLRLSPKQK